VLALLSTGAQARDGAGAEGLVHAVAADDVAGATAALAAGADVNATFAYGESALARAVETQDPAMVAALLDHGAKPDSADAQGLTPLALACERGNGDIVGALLDHRADVRKGAPDGTTPLAVCARFGPAGTVPRMLAMGAKADSADMRGQTPLMWAASSGNVEAMSALIAAGAQVNRITKSGFTPLFFAIKSGVPEAARMLIAAGADTSYRGPENTSALQLALYQKNWEVAGILAERGGDLTEIDRNGNRPLHVAAAAGDTALIARLLSKGADPNGLTGPSRITWVTEANFGMPPPPVPPTPPLLIAAQNGQVEAMKLLVEAGANKAFVAENGTNVVLAAAHGHSAAALDYALTLAPDANVTDGSGSTALHILLFGGMHAELEAMLRVLARHGALTDIANKRDTTAAQVAEKGLTTVRTVYRRVFTDEPAPEQNAPRN
jgi:ankyrin repeat protein